MLQESKQLKIIINGVEKNVIGQIIDQNFWCYVDQETFCFPVSDLQPSSRLPKRAVKTAKAVHLIVAPMPGRITKIFVNEGDDVKKSQALLVMEAMKMEYTLKSDLETRVEKINVQLGDQVTLGRLLIRLQTKSES